jgi:hypothetical protein
MLPIRLTSVIGLLLTHFIASSAFVIGASSIASVSPNVIRPISSMVTAHGIGSISSSGSSSSALQMALPTGTLIRGGAKVIASAAVDGFSLDRTKIRLEGLSSYGVVTAVLMGATLRLFGSTNTDLSKEKNQKLLNVAKIIFSVSAIVSVVSGAYTTVVFSLLGLYAKTALGMGLDARFMEFFAATEPYRKCAFWTFLLSLFTFETCFVSKVCLRYTGKHRWLAVVLATVGVGISCWHWIAIIGIAGKLLFAK